LIGLFLSSIIIDLEKDYNKAKAAPAQTDAACGQTQAEKIAQRAFSMA